MKPLEVDKLGKQFQFITLDFRDVNSAVTNDKNSSSKVTINFNIYEHSGGFLKLHLFITYANLPITIKI